MRRLLWIVGVLLALVVVAWVVGYMQPLDHTATYTAVMPAGQDAVWERIANVQAQPTWRKGLKVSPAPSSEGRPCWHEEQGNMPLLMCVNASAPKTLRQVELSNPGSFHGTWTYTLQPVSATQTRVSLTETVLIYRPSWRFAMLLLGRNFLSRQVLKQLAASFGGTPQPAS